MEIKIDNLTDIRTLELIKIHLAGMAENSPAESRRFSKIITIWEQQEKHPFFH